ncbi:MAG: zinc-ribbon domain-containing protein [Candidatus Marinimicrobia bacterium]|nr:zinc-ribbon domain-containing protein [Candidatus Neomarinimicrobiota bacterium]
MKKILSILFLLGTLSAQSSSFKSFDVVIYPEYYFDGIMAEIDGEVKDESLPLNLEISVPANTDSVFYVGGTAESEAEVKHLSVLKSKNRSLIQVSVVDSKFRLFVFYPIEKNGTSRSGNFNLEINSDVEDAHVIIQEPLIAENFSFSEKDAETFQDQHGLNFKRIHLHDFRANTNKAISFSYENPTGGISINALQTMLSNDDNAAIPSAPSVKTAPVRHKLPLWQPLVVLGIVAVIVGGMFYAQRKSELKDNFDSKPQKGNGKFCTGCGAPIQDNHKFCANCGGEL